MVPTTILRPSGMNSTAVTMSCCTAAVATRPPGAAPLEGPEAAAPDAPESDSRASDPDPDPPALGSLASAPARVASHRRTLPSAQPVANRPEMEGWKRTDVTKSGCRKTRRQPNSLMCHSRAVLRERAHEWVIARGSASSSGQGLGAVVQGFSRDSYRGYKPLRSSLVKWRHLPVNRC
jgi:hypothetical protein